MAARLTAALLIGPLAAGLAGDSGAPSYTAESIANTAASLAAYYAPNTFLSIYGEELAFVTRAISPDDIRAGELPTVLPGTGVRVFLNLVPADVFFVSPRQVNVLVPASFGPGRVTLQLVRDGVAGPAIALNLAAAAPSFFSPDGRSIVATHADGTLVTEEAPARKGETVVVYATGLGPTNPATPPNRIAPAPAPLANMKDFRVLLNGIAVDPGRVPYVGLTPGFAGLYQINLELPDDAPAGPEIRAGYADAMSPPGRLLILR